MVYFGKVINLFKRLIGADLFFVEFKEPISKREGFIQIIIRPNNRKAEPVYNREHVIRDHMIAVFNYNGETKEMEFIKE